eukprot:2330572-Pleurochrysis_carterae.AAC.1
MPWMMTPATCSFIASRNYSSMSFTGRTKLQAVRSIKLSSKSQQIANHLGTLFLLPSMGPWITAKAWLMSCGDNPEVNMASDEGAVTPDERQRNLATRKPQSARVGGRAVTLSARGHNRRGLRC